MKTAVDLKRGRPCGIALGSNLGDRTANIQTAIEEILKLPGVIPDSFRQASLDETEPVDCPQGSPPFLNTVIVVDFAGKSFALLESTQAIEKRLGRRRSGVRNEPRTIDIDLLFLGNEVINTERLTLPHPRLAQRRFVLQPLAELCPDLVLPGQVRSVSTLLEHSR